MLQEDRRAGAIALKEVAPFFASARLRVRLPLMVQNNQNFPNVPRCGQSTKGAKNER
jgi:hypothetical protein